MMMYFILEELWMTTQVQKFRTGDKYSPYWVWDSCVRQEEEISALLEIT